MKKILFGIFAIMLGATSAYCDNEQKTIDPNGSYQDVLQSEVRVDAIRTVLKNDFMLVGLTEAGAFSISKFILELRKTAVNGITVESVQNACTKEIQSESYCAELMEYIIREHNKLCLENDAGILSESDFNKLIRSALECPLKMFKGSEVGYKDSCIRACRGYAIEHICEITDVDFNQDDEAGIDICFCNPLGSNNDYDTIYRYTPTYEDYKKAKRGEWF